MWKRFSSTCFILFLLIQAASGQEAIRTSVLSTIFSDIPGTPRVVNNEPGRFWVVGWRQNGTPSSINCRMVRSDGTLGSTRTLVSSPSAVPRNFDLTYLRQTGNYLLAYELQNALYVQSFNKNFTRQGPAVAIQKGVRETQPHFLTNTSSKRVFLFWLADPSVAGHKIIRRVEMDASGKRSGAMQNLSTAPAGNAYESFSVAENPKDGIHFAIATQSAQTGGTKIVGLAFHVDGTRLHQAPILFQQFASKMTLHPNVAFSTSTGAGIAVWQAGSQIRYRFLSTQGNPSAPAQIFSNAADLNSNPVATFDSKKEVFVETWTKGQGIFASAIDPVLEAEDAEFNSIATSTGNALNADSSFDNATGKSIVTWEEQTGNTYRVHATVFLVHGEEFAVQGTVVLRKDYKPPFQLNGKKYLYKFHVKSDGKIYRAYVTPESEIIGALPKEGNQVRMIYEPFRGRYRGYVESIQIVVPAQ